jgi:hypothetical protein
MSRLDGRVPSAVEFNTALHDGRSALLHLLAHDPYALTRRPHRLRGRRGQCRKMKCRLSAVALAVMAAQLVDEEPLGIGVGALNDTITSPAPLVGDHGIASLDSQGLAVC